MSQTRFPRPMEDRVIILPDEQQDDPSGIQLPDELRDKPKTGTVAAVGKGTQAKETAEWIEMQCEVGDKVLFGKYAGATIIFDEVEYILLKQGDILAVL